MLGANVANPVPLYFVKNRRDTSSNWTGVNPVLRPGEIGLESDTGLFKFGDGVHTWQQLSYANSSSVSVTSVNGLTGNVIITASSIGADLAGAASSAQSAAEAYAATQASTAQSNAETFATGIVTTETSRAESAESSLSTSISNEISRAETAEGLLAPLASPTFTGIPAAPTATAGTSTTQLATTAFVGTAITNNGTGVSSAAATYLNSIICPGIVGDGVTDNSLTIQTALSAIDITKEASELVVISPTVGGSVYINGTVQVQQSNVTLRFASPVIYGPNGRISIYGTYIYTTPSSPPVLTVAASAGATSITVSNGSYFPVGTYLEVRGDHDATGAALWEDYALVTANTAGSGTTATLTLDTPLANSYSVTYTDGGSSEVVAIASSLATVQPVRGNTTVTVASTSAFSVGQYVQILDDSLNESSSLTSQAQNYLDMEIAQVLSITNSTQMVLTHALHHTYSLTYNARVVGLQPVMNSHIKDAQVTWSATSVVDNAFEIKFGVNCSVQNSVCSGGTYSWQNDAFRQTNSYFCFIDNCYAEYPVNTSAGYGYGHTIYGGTYCTIRNSKATACRHSFLHYNGAVGNLVTGCMSVDACLSDFDFHGANTWDNRVTDCIAVGGTTVPTDNSTPQKNACNAGNPNHLVGDFNVTFENIRVVNYTYGGNAAALSVVPQSSGITFRNIRVETASYGMWFNYLSANPTLLYSSIVVENCTFDNCTNLSQINGSSSANMSGLVIQNNTFINAATALTIDYVSGAKVLKNTWVTPSLPSQTYAVYAQNCPSIYIKNNDMSQSVRGVKLSGSTNARITGNTMHDFTDTTVYEDAGGNSGTLFRNNDIFGFSLYSSPPIPLGVRVSGSGPSSGSVIDTLPLYMSDHPAKRGFLEWNFNPEAMNTSSKTLTTSGTVYLVKISPLYNTTVTNINVYMGSNGATLTSGENFLGLYDYNGNLMSATADQTTAWGSGAPKLITTALTTPQTVYAGYDYYVAFLFNGTTSPGFAAGANVPGPMNVGLSNAYLRFAATNSTSVTSLPSTITESSNTSTNASAIFVALS
jgi:hypothetical protein